MTCTRTGIFAFCATALLLGPLSAQQPPALAPGQSVRVSAPSAGLDQTEGKVLAMRGRDIVLAVERFRPHHERLDLQADNLNVAVPLDSIRSLWVPAGTRSHATGFAVLGWVVGMAAGALTYSPRPVCTDNSLCGLQELGDVYGRLAWVTLGGGVGAGIGALIGSHVRTTTWKPVPPDELARLRVGIAALLAGRLGLGATVRF